MVGAIKQMHGTDVQMSLDRCVDKMHRCAKYVTANGSAAQGQGPWWSDQ